MYVEDCRAAFGKLFGHDDSINDRAPGLQLENGFQRTANLYAHTFGRQYTFAGGMWRGPAPPSGMAPVLLRTASQPSASRAGTPRPSGHPDGAGSVPLSEHDAGLQALEQQNGRVVTDSTGQPHMPGAPKPGGAAPMGAHSTYGILADRSAAAAQSSLKVKDARNGHHAWGNDGQADVASQEASVGWAEGPRGNGQNVENGQRRSGFLRKVSGLLRFQRHSKKAAANGKLPRQVPELGGSLPWVFGVEPVAEAAARDASGDALGHQGGAVIQPCYEADRPLPGE